MNEWLRLVLVGLGGVGLFAISRWGSKEVHADSSRRGGVVRILDGSSAATAFAVLAGEVMLAVIGGQPLVAGGFGLVLVVGGFYWRRARQLPRADDPDSSGPD